METEFDLHDYSDIIDQPHHISEGRRRMSNVERGAQFSPFAALTGYDAAVDEAGRITELFRELSEDEKAIIDAKLHYLLEHSDEELAVSIVCFYPDFQKAGGEYRRINGCIKGTTQDRRSIILSDRSVIAVNSIYALDCDVFDRLDIE